MDFRTWFEAVDTLELVDLIYTPGVQDAVERVLDEMPPPGKKSSDDVFGANDTVDEFVEKINNTPAVEKSNVWFIKGRQREKRHSSFLVNASADTERVRDLTEIILFENKPRPKNVKDLLGKHYGGASNFINLDVNSDWFNNRKPAKTVHNDIKSILAHEMTHIHVAIQQELKNYKSTRSIWDMAKIGSDTEYYTWQDEPAANANSLAYDIVNQHYVNPLGQQTLSIYWKLPDNHNIKRNVFRDMFKIATKYISPQEYSKRLKEFVQMALQKQPYEGEQDRVLLSKIKRFIYDPYTNTSLTEKIKSLDRYRKSHPHLIDKIQKIIKSYLYKRTEKQYSYHQVMRDAMRKLMFIDKHPNIPEGKKIEMAHKILEPYSDDNKQIIISKGNLSPELLKRLQPSDTRIDDFLRDLEQERIRQGAA